MSGAILQQREESPNRNDRPNDRPNDWAWDDMLAEFRALGGVAENIRLGQGKFGRGLFPIDPAQPVKILASPNLLYPVDDLEFENGALRVKKDAQIGNVERTFFNAYQQAFSWGSGGGADALALMEAMDTLPEPLRETLGSQFGLRVMFGGSAAERAQKYFLRSRRIQSQGRPVVMPVVELVNHNPYADGFDFDNGIAVKGTFPGEVFVRYNLADSIGVLMNWGFASEEPLALSLPMNITIGSRRLIIKRNIKESQKLENRKAPVVVREGDKVTLSYLILGNIRLPRQPKSVFHLLANDIGIPHTEDIFDRILHFNRMRVLGLLAHLNREESPIAATLREVCRYQLQAMSHCVGRHSNSPKTP